MDSRSGDSTPVQGGSSSRQIQRLPSLRSLGSLYNAVTSPLRPTNPPRKASDADSISADDDMSLEPIAHPPAHQHQQPQQPTASQIHLSTQCQSCGETVAVQVPDWMLSAHARITDYEQAAAAQQQQSARPRSRSDLRDKLVQGAVSGAVAFKNSPVSLQIRDSKLSNFADACGMIRSYHSCWPSCGQFSLSSSTSTCGSRCTKRCCSSCLRSWKA